MKRSVRIAVLGACLLLGSCSALTEKEPLRITPKSEVASSPVVREVLPQPAAPVAQAQPVESAPVAQAQPVESGPSAAPPAAPPPGVVSSAPTLAIVAPPAAIAPPPAAALIPPKLPAGTLYVCSGTVNGQLQQTAIEYEPRVRQLCAKHPEMSVCQYERENCRNSGGQVFDTAGKEITRQIEAEYDKKVMRVRFRS